MAWLLMSSVVGPAVEMRMALDVERVNPELLIGCKAVHDAAGHVGVAVSVVVGIEASERPALGWSPRSRWC